MHELAHGLTLNLHDDLFASTRCDVIGEHGTVNLGDRCCGQRFAIELGEHGFERFPEVRFDHCAHDIEWFRWNLIAALDEFVDEFFREDSLATRDDLTELDVGRAEDFGRFAQASRDVGGRYGPALAAAGDVPQRNCSTETARNLDQAPASWHFLGAHKVGELTLDGRANRIDAVAPASLFQRHLPRSAVAKRSEGEIAFEFGHAGGGIGQIGHVSSVRRGLGQCVP